jgi:hypothetical protein
VVRRLYPGPAAEQVHLKSADLIRRSNALVLDHLLRVYALTAKPGAEQDTGPLAASLRAGCMELAAEAEGLTRRMKRLQLVEKKFRQAGVGGALQDSSLLRGIFRV